MIALKYVCRACHCLRGISTVRGDNNLSEPDIAVLSRVSLLQPSPSGDEFLSPRSCTGTDRGPAVIGGVLPVVSPVVKFKIGSIGCRDAGGEPKMSRIKPRN
jgi:hypothetical protein